MIVDKPVVMEKCQGCKCMFPKDELTEYLGCLLCGFCIAYQETNNHPEDDRRGELS